MAAIPFQGLRTCIYKVGNLPQAVEWYTKLLGKPPYFNEPYYVGFEVAGYELGLQAVEKNHKIVENVATYWAVEDIDGEYQRILNLGATEHESPNEVGGGVKVASLRDPWGNLLGIIYNPHFGANPVLPPTNREEENEPRAMALGGIFFKSPNPERLKQWYEANLGVTSGKYGTTFQWKKNDGSNGFTAWSVFSEDTDYFDPAKQDFMLNYRVANLDALLDKLREAGAKLIGKIDEYDYGRFAWFLDPDGNKVELWEPNDEVYGAMEGAKIESC